MFNICHTGNYLKLPSIIVQKANMTRADPESSGWTKKFEQGNYLIPDDDDNEYTGLPQENITWK